MGYEFIEIQKFGYNPTTVGFLGTVFFTLVQVWGLSDQAATIRRKRSGKSIPMHLFAFFAGEQFAFFVYGYQSHRLAAMVNGALGFWYLWVYIEAIKHPDSGGGRWWHYVIMAMLAPLLWYFPYPEALMMALIVIVTLTLTETPRNIIRNKDIGTVDVLWLYTITASMAFWVIYTSATGFWTLCACSLLGFGIMVWALDAWYRYRKKPQSA